jgi:geranylgeranyl diphosphate synthase, type I
MTVSYLDANLGAAAVDVAMRDFFTARRAEADAFGADFAATVAELESYVLRGGKRIRPAFAWLGWSTTTSSTRPGPAVAIRRRT